MDNIRRAMILAFAVMIWIGIAKYSWLIVGCFMLGSIATFYQADRRFEVRSDQWYTSMLLFGASSFFVVSPASSLIAIPYLILGTTVFVTAKKSDYEQCYETISTVVPDYTFEEYIEDQKTR